jgi:hypothetical protein
MSELSVVGSGPVSFTTSAGQAKLIPLSALVFKEGNIGFRDGVAIDPDVKSEAKEWLQYLVKIDELKAGEKPAPKPAIAFEAVESGAIGKKFRDLIAYPLPSIFQPTTSILR